MLKSNHVLRACGNYVNTSIGKFCTKPERSIYSKKKEIYGDLFPDKLLNKKHKTPLSMYMANEDAAEFVMNAIEPHLSTRTDQIAVEINPGIGVFTRQLLKRQDLFSQLMLIESTDHFMKGLKDLQLAHADRVQLKYGDMINLWKLAFQDKMDNGSRVSNLLEDVPRRAHEEDTNFTLFGAVGSYNFFKHLINSLIFQNSLLSLGRCEMFLLVPPPIYIHLTCSNTVGYMIYRSATMLFQILFEYRFIAKVPRAYFLPTQTDRRAVKGSKLERVTSINPDLLYLIKIEPRRNIFDMCSPADLPALWYFIKQNCVSRRNRVIPNLEKWVPSCGPRLIINTQETEPVTQLFPDENIDQLPKFSVPCTTLSSRDFFSNMTIYTQFGDLNPSQMMSLFGQFRSWPEYSESSFLASLENSLLKMETSADDNIDVIVEEDDAVEIAADSNITEDKTAAVEETSSKINKETNTDAITNSYTVENTKTNAEQINEVNTEENKAPIIDAIKETNSNIEETKTPAKRKRKEKAA